MRHGNRCCRLISASEHDQLKPGGNIHIQQGGAIYGSALFYFTLQLLREELTMKLDDYFDLKKGIGVLSTADGEGKVDAAIYARPHFMDDGTVAFIMRDRLSHHNLQSNPHATFLFKEDGLTT